MQRERLCAVLAAGTYRRVWRFGAGDAALKRSILILSLILAVWPSGSVLVWDHQSYPLRGAWLVLEWTTVSIRYTGHTPTSRPLLKHHIYTVFFPAEGRGPESSCGWYNIQFITWLLLFCRRSRLWYGSLLAEIGMPCTSSVRPIPPMDVNQTSSVIAYSAMRSMNKVGYFWIPDL